jgi:pectin methylesterase-like acyl-CoA thioesterase
MYRIKGEGNPITITENGKEITIPSPMTILTAPNTSICGEGMKNTQIESMPMHEGISCTSTLFLKGADSTYIQDIELWSNYRDDMTAFASRAVALNEKNCKGNIFKNLSLMSNQDTYYTNDGGTTYLEDCTIKGTVDFICGGGTIYFNRCDIELRNRGGKSDVICAPATEANRNYGYVFNSCRIYGSPEQAGKYMLGRPWKNAPRAVFLGTMMELQPDSLGWTEMHGTLPRLFSEYESLDTEFQLTPTARRRTQFKDANNVVTNVRYNPNLSVQEAEKYDINNVFPGWYPDSRSAQVLPPEVHIKDRGTIYWEDIPEAYLYAVCKNRDVVAFTTEPQYTVPKGTPEGSCYSIRCANYYGGLGERSNEVVYPNR